MTSHSILAGKTAIVTGASRGIGRSAAIELATLGVRVALVARSYDALVSTADAVAANGGTAGIIHADLADLSQIPDVVKQAEEHLGSVDILINNAAVIWPFGPSTAISAHDWATAITINLTSVATLSFAVLPGMLDRRWGRIVNVSSGVAAMPTMMPRGNAYATSKAALEAHTVNLAAEYAGTGVGINIFRPGSVDTAMQEWIRDQDPDLIGVDLHGVFVSQKAGGFQVSADATASQLIRRLDSDETGQIWDYRDAPA